MSVEYFRIDAVLILLAQALRRTAGAGAVVTDAIGVVLVVGAAGAGDLQAGRVRAAVLDNERIVAVCQLDAARRTVAPLRRHPSSPTFRRKIQMGIARNYLNLA